MTGTVRLPVRRRTLFMANYFKEFLDSRGFTEESFYQQFEFEDRRIAGTDEACELLHGMDKNARIGLLSDYDVDGLMCGVIGYAGLHLLGFNNMFLVQRDISLGYELVPEDIDRAEGPELIITSDVGVTCVKALDYAREQGIKVLVTDHHMPSGPVPEVDAIVCYTLDKAFQAGNAAVCGAYTLWQILDRYMELYKDEYAAGDWFNRYGDLKLLRHFAALATVSDSMPLVGRNHGLVADMLKFFNYINPLSGSSAIVSGVCRDGIVQNVFNNFHTYVLQFQDNYYTGFTQRFLEYSLIPAMNSVRRMRSDISLVYQMFFGPELQALECAEILVELNEERKAMVAGYMEVLTSGEQSGPVFLTDAPAGVLGLLATRLSTACGRPCCVLNQTPEFDENVGRVCYSGSARSFDWYPFLTRVNMSGYGHCSGHEVACGVSVAVEDLENFRAFLIHDTDSLSPADTVGSKVTSENVAERFDVLMDFDDNIFTFVDDVETLMTDIKRHGPFGPGLLPPKLLLKFHIRNGAIKLLKEGKHTKLTLVSPGEGAERGMPTMQVLCWNMNRDALDSTSSGDGYVYLTGYLQDSYFMGNRYIDFVASPALDP